MSATIWTEVESGSDSRPASGSRQGYWSGNQGHPQRRPLLDLDESADFHEPLRLTGPQ